MFRVDVDSLEAYFDFDPKRKPDLQKLDALIRQSAPALTRHFHEGTPAGEAGMRMKMIGYGRFSFVGRRGRAGQAERVIWPVVGIALQKNYISVYLAIAKDGAPLLDAYKGTLGELRAGGNNFSFQMYEDLQVESVGRLFAEAARIFAAEPMNPIRYKQGG
jgi:hypothetical protein